MQLFGIWIGFMLKQLGPNQVTLDLAKRLPHPDDPVLWRCIGQAEGMKQHIDSPTIDVFLEPIFLFG